MRKGRSYNLVRTHFLEFVELKEGMLPGHVGETLCGRPMEGWRFAIIGIKKLQDVSDEGHVLSCNGNPYVMFCLHLKILDWFCYSRRHTVQFNI